MCRISGLIGHDSALIDKMLLHQHVGGPDYSGWMFCDEDQRIVFGNNRLAIVGPSPAGNQPMESARYVITYNGEIYNYKSMQEALSPADNLLTGGGPGNDTHTFLLYIEKYGLTKALNDANGMFAFALYDKWEQVLYLCVDRFGQKPLYYTIEQDNKLAFASSPAALTVLKDEWRLNRSAILGYFQLGAPMGHASLWAGVFKLCAGEMACFDTQTGHFKHIRWYDPQSIVASPPLRLSHTIDLTLRSANDPYLFLSGGVDSTIIASHMPGGRAVHLDSPERAYAEQTATRFDMKMEIASNKFSIDHAHASYCAHSGEPSAAAHIPWQACRRVSELGGKVAITANGADELFFGYPRTKEKRTAAQDHHMKRGCLLEPWHPHYGTHDGRLHELSVYVQHDLCRTLDFAAACHGIEVRAPFLDHNLVEAALAIPEETHRARGDKSILKARLSNLGFDRSFMERQKQGFSIAPDREYIEKGEEALEKCVELGYLPKLGRLNARDTRYLQAAAFSFLIWAEVWAHKTAKTQV